MTSKKYILTLFSFLMFSSTWVHAHQVYKFKVEPSLKVKTECDVNGQKRLSQVKLIILDKPQAPNQTKALARIELCTIFGYNRMYINVDWSDEMNTKKSGSYQLPDIYEVTNKLAEKVFVTFDQTVAAKANGFDSSKFLPLSRLSFVISEFSFQIDSEIRLVEEVTEI